MNTTSQQIDLASFEREMKAKRNAEAHPWVKSYLSNICIATEALKNPVNDVQLDKLLANISFQAAKIAAHRQAQGGGR